MPGNVCLEHSGMCSEIEGIKDDISVNIKPDIKTIQEDIKGLTKHVYYAAGMLGLALVVIEKVWK